MSSAAIPVSIPEKPPRPRKLTVPVLLTDISYHHQMIALGFSENPAEDRDKIYHRVGQLYDKFCSVCIYAANNEQTPWTSEEIGLQVLPMRTKRETGKNQTGDYHAALFLPGEPGHTLGLIIERKSVADLHGTLMSKNHERFNREIDRYHADPDIKQMRVFVEGSKAEFMAFRPPSVRYSHGQIKGMFVRKRASIEGLEAREVSVCFQGSRKEAAASVRDAVRQYAIKNYGEWLNL